MDVCMFYEFYSITAHYVNMKNVFLKCKKCVSEIKTTKPSRESSSSS